MLSGRECLMSEEETRANCELDLCQASGVSQGASLSQGKDEGLCETDGFYCQGPWDGEKGVSRRGDRLVCKLSIWE